jgi:Flp pilus assembly pilin Flp
MTSRPVSVVQVVCAGAVRARRDTRGVSYVEYLILLGVVALFAIAAWRRFANTVTIKIARQAETVRTLDGPGTSPSFGNSLGDPGETPSVGGGAVAVGDPGVADPALPVAPGLGQTDADPLGGVIKPLPGQPQTLPPAVAKLVQQTFDALAVKNGYRLDVSKVQFVVKDLGGPVGQTVRDVIYISPEELSRPLSKQLYTIGHELTHVLQFEVSPGANADAKWASLNKRYAADAAKYGQGGAYSRTGISGPLSDLNVLDRRFGAEGLAAYVGLEVEGSFYDAVRK